MFNAFYRDKRLLVLSIAVIIVAGLSSYFVLPRLEDPTLTPRFAIVTTLFPGARADRVEVLVSDRMEEELQEIEEIKEIRSTSRAGASAMVIELRDDVYEVGEIWSRIRDKIDDAKALFPEGVGEPDIEMITTKAYASILGLKWTLDDKPNYAILLRLSEQLEDRMRAIPGTEDVEAFGDPEEEIAVEVRQAQLASVGLNAADVAQQLAASDAKLSAGQVRSTESDFLMEVDSELDSIDRIASTPIRYGSNGRFVRLGDVATVQKGIVQPPSSMAIVNGAHAVILGTLVRSDFRLDLWNAEAQQVVADFEAHLPRGVEVVHMFEQSPYVEARLVNLLWNLLMGGAAVVFVIFFLMGWRSAIVVGAALPLSAFMVLAGMRFMEIPMHQMSITGLIIALGLLIDNAIVMVDEVKTRMEEGDGAAHAVAAATRHLAIPLFGSTLTTGLAFAPIALMPGPAGEFVGTIAISVMLAISSSFILAMTVTPALAAIFENTADAEGKHWWINGLHSPKMTLAWQNTVDFLLSRPLLSIGLSIALPVMGFVQARLLQEQFFPAADRNQFQIELELPPQASIYHTEATAKRLSEIALAHPEVTGIDWVLGQSAPSFYYNIVKRRENNAPYGQAIVHLKSAEGAEHVINQLQKEFDRNVPEARAIARQLEQGPPFDAPVELQIFGPDLHVLRDLGEEIRAQLALIPEVTHTRSDLGDDLPKFALVLDEEKARLAGLDHAQVARQLAAATEGALGGTVLEETEELPVRVRLPESERAKLADISSLDLISPAVGDDSPLKTIPFSAIGSLELKPEISAVTRLDKQRMNEVKAYLQAGVLPSVVLNKLQDRMKAAGIELPTGYHLSLGGEAKGRDQAIGNLMSSVGVLMVLMVATLVLSFSSFRAATLIGCVGFLSVGLGLASLWLFGFPFGFMAIVGTMGLIGVAINDSIVVLAALREDDKAREGDPLAVREVVMKGTRHVVATTATTVVGFLPLVLAGGGFWPPLAISIAGGVVGATMLALTFVPTVHMVFANPAVLNLPCRKKRSPARSAAPSQADPVAEEGVPLYS
ncbi:AcrB/AcrD/AcrF family protein [Bremerella cremea]|uniref:Acriflavine resistance protein B n=1 Tax=Blastopirellula marina TaxID=124 RepID=A0A2S8F8P9_9BACT|nr:MULTISPECIES: efflux RND transporter permease subunit [Pirellulaceae]PQO28543.1 acriflavine resistance protein B [Blastopirellula marina]RCS41913.1 AcrB/AcrD/AcrF family protein [Bremerella cremea]